VWRLLDQAHVAIVPLRVTDYARFATLQVDAGREGHMTQPFTRPQSCGVPHVAWLGLQAGRESCHDEKSSKQSVVNERISMYHSLPLNSLDPASSLVKHSGHNLTEYLFHHVQQLDG
jgi:hypothetical protein